MLNYVILQIDIDFDDETLPNFCPMLVPETSSDCLTHDMTTAEEKDFYEPDSYDICCYFVAIISGTEEKGCTPETKNNVNEAKTKEYLEDYYETTIDSFSLKCSESDPEPDSGSDPEPDSGSDPEPDSGSGSDSNSIWLSLSLSFLFFGLLF